MKYVLIVLVTFLSLSVQSQDFKKLLVNVKSKVEAGSTIYLEPIDKDRLLLNEHFKNSLNSNGYKVVSDKKDAKYLIIVSYKDREDTGCGGYVIKEMSGQIIDINNSADVVVTFTFSQGGFEGKCAIDILSALAKKIKGE